MGVLIDGSGHFGSTDRTVGSSNGVGYILGGLQYKYHTDTFSPFARVFVGTSRIDPAVSASEWNVAVGGWRRFRFEHNPQVRAPPGAGGLHLLQL